MDDDGNSSTKGFQRLIKSATDGFALVKNFALCSVLSVAPLKLQQSSLYQLEFEGILGETPPDLKYCRS